MNTRGTNPNTGMNTPMLGSSKIGPCMTRAMRTPTPTATAIANAVPQAVVHCGRQ